MPSVKNSYRFGVPDHLYIGSLENSDQAYICNYSSVYLTSCWVKMDVLQKSKSVFSQAYQQIFYVVPNLSADIRPTPASSLKLATLDNWPEDRKLVSKGHFVAVKLDNINNFPLNNSILTNWYEKTIEKLHVQRQFTEMVHVEVLTCARDMFKNIGILRGCTDNEAELRFAYGNPIVSMLCSIHKYSLSVEDKLRTPKAGTTSCDIMTSADKISEKSTADYICYTLHHTTNMKLAAVIIETKTDFNYTDNAIAQLMGYYLRACKKEDGHSVAILLTESKVHLLLFPFTNGYKNCINAVWLQSIKYSKQDISGIIDMLFLLTVVTHENFCIDKLKLEERFLPKSKDHTFEIQTEIQLMLEEVKKEKKMVAKEKEELAGEKEALEREKEAVAKEKEALEREKEAVAKEKEAVAAERNGPLRKYLKLT